MKIWGNIIQIPLYRKILLPYLQTVFSSRVRDVQHNPESIGHCPLRLGFIFNDCVFFKKKIYCLTCGPKLDAIETSILSYVCSVTTINCTFWLVANRGRPGNFLETSLKLPCDMTSHYCFNQGGGHCRHISQLKLK